MLLSRFASVVVVATSSVLAATLNDVCTKSYVQSVLPTKELYLADGTNTAITIDLTSVNATVVTDFTVMGSVMYPDANFDYCDVMFAYSHVGRGDKVHVRYWLPTPSNFKRRYLSTGGGGFAINSGTQSLPGGVQYGAVSGATDGGFGNFSTNLDQVWLSANGTGDYESLHMFGYKAVHELTILGKLLTREYFNMSDTKLYSYYQGCSEGGRDGWSQVQRFADAFDGVITGAPAFRFAHQQVQHLYSNIVERTLDYYPPPCELARIVNATIAFCDPLDGKTDGVVSRTDLCKLQFDLNSTIGLPYYCAASPASMKFPPFPAAPAQNGTVSAQGAKVARAIIDGLHNSQGHQAYFSYTPSSIFFDAATLYNSTARAFGLYINSMGGEYVAQFLQLLDLTNLSNLDNVTYDTLVQWMTQGWQIYDDSLQTTWPDLTSFQQAGGKVLQYHGESDFSIPTASSVHYHESARSIMYPSLSFNDSTKALSDWYQLYLVPGAAHCNVNEFQPNGPFPQTNLAVMIDWVENGIKPVTLNATILQGESIGTNQQICAWPLRPLWTENGTRMECVYDQDSIDSWMYDLNAFKLPVY